MTNESVLLGMLSASANAYTEKSGSRNGFSCCRYNCILLIVSVTKSLLMVEGRTASSLLGESSESVLVSAMISFSFIALCSNWNTGFCLMPKKQSNRMKIEKESICRVMGSMYSLAEN